MPTIGLTQGQRARVDWQDYRELVKYRWCARWDPSARAYYAVRSARIKDGSPRHIYMHRQILGLEYGDGKLVDHENHDTLDNRRRNIRVCTRRQNAENQRNQSRYGVGVRRLPSGAFFARALLNGKVRHVGTFARAEEARRAREQFLEEQSR